MEVQYLTDEKGRRHSVVVPIAEWEKIMKLLNGGDVTADVLQSLDEVELILKGKLPQHTLKDFWAENE